MRISIFILSFLLMFSCERETDIDNIKNENNNSSTTQKAKIKSFISCDPKSSNETLEVATWNLEFFPKNGKSTISEVADIIKSQKIDIIALQEINDKTDFERLINKLGNQNWGGFRQKGDGIKLAYIYNKNEIEIVKKPYNIYRGNSYEFPRRPYVTEIFHKKTKLNSIIINNHLKARPGSENQKRRKLASQLLQKWINTTHPDKNVIVLGDFNDKIIGNISRGETSPFVNFMNDSSNFAFADLDITNKNSDYWSHLYPSHIDHIIVSNELFDNIKKIITFNLEDCISNYRNQVSDHKPVCLILE